MCQPDEHCAAPMAERPCSKPHYVEMTCYASVTNKSMHWLIILSATIRVAAYVNGKLLPNAKCKSQTLLQPR